MMSSHLQGNAGRSCLLLWNAKNVASPKYGPCHTHKIQNGQQKGLGTGMLRKQCLRLTTKDGKKKNLSTHWTWRMLDRQLKPTNKTATQQMSVCTECSLKAASTFCNHIEISWVLVVFCCWFFFWKVPDLETGRLNFLKDGFEIWHEV